MIDQARMAPLAGMFVRGYRRIEAAHDEQALLERYPEPWKDEGERARRQFLYRVHAVRWAIRRGRMGEWT